MATESVDLLIVGAGPTGLSAAVEARRHGLSFKIIDKKPHRSTFSKALVVHARTMEALETMGVAEAMLEAGRRFVALNLRFGQDQTPTRVDLLEREWGDTRYPFWLSIPQYESERILEERLVAQGAAVAWQTELVNLVNGPEGCEAQIQGGDEAPSTVEARWVLGCDGGRSAVRGFMGVEMERADLGATFVLCDAHTTADLSEDEGYGALADAGLVLIVPMPEAGLFRVIAHVMEEPADGAIDDPAWWDRLIAERMGIQYGAHNLAWTSQFRLSQGVAGAYRRSSAFILGDAAHIHSPVGGQGMNTGIQDAHNLVWKLATAARTDTGAEALLDSYEAERRPIAEAMVKGTSQATKVVTARRRGLRFLLGSAARWAMRSEAVQDRLGRGVGMLDLAYEDSPVTAEVEGDRQVDAGQRLPNPELEGGGRLHDLLDGLRHTVFVFPSSEGPQWDAWPGPQRKIVVGGKALPDTDGRITQILGAQPGDRLLVRPDRIVAAMGQPADLLARFPELIGVPPTSL